MAKKRKSGSKAEPKPESKIPKSLLSSDGESDDDEEEENELSSCSSEEKDDDEDSKLESIKELLEPFSKGRLITILKEAAQLNASITAEIISAAESDPVHRKIFVHGLGWDCSNETLVAAFKPFGAVEECNVVTDKTTGRSKGYGFVLFMTRAAVRKALKQPQKKIGNRLAACQLASTGPVQNQNKQGPDMSARKLYVSNVGPQLSAAKLRAFFSKFGEIEDGPLGFDKVTGRFRGFAIIIYKTLEGIKKALEEPLKVFDGIELLCSIAAKNNINAGAGQTPVNVTTGANSVVMPGLAVGLNPGPVFLGQNPAALGVFNPVLGVGAGTYANGVSQPIGNAAFPVGLSTGFGTEPGISNINPSVIGSYGSQAALQGLGVYQSSQLGQPSASASAIGAAAARPQTGIGPYFGR